MITDDYIKEVNAAYWAEEDEMRMGIHPTQIRAKIEAYLIQNKIVKDTDSMRDIFLNWVGNNRVEVSIDGDLIGTFDYKENTMEEYKNEED